MGDGLIILTGLAILGILIGTPVATVVLWLRQRRLIERLGQLEAVLTAGLARAPLDVPPDLPVAPVTATEAPAAIPAAGAVEGPWTTRTPPVPEPETEEIAQPGSPPDRGAVVFRRERLAALSLWLRTNWAFTLSAVSLALAGIFFVQYGIEAGLLPPPLRVVAAVAFGLGLVAAGEWVRRRGGEGDEAPALYLPSVFSAAGLVSIYAAVVAGRLLYGLYGPGLTLVGLLTTTLGAILLGWRHGPFLVAMGLVGAGAAPFLVAGESGATATLYPYYLLVAFLGLAVDAFRRWAWVSVLALAVGAGGAFLMFLGGAGQEGWALSLAGFVVLAVVVPARALIPDHEAPAVSDRLLGAGPPAFPVRLALGMVAVASLALWLSIDDLWSFGTLAALSVALVVLSLRAPGIGDLAILPAAAFLARIWTAEDMARSFGLQSIALREPETSPPATVTALLVMAGVVSMALSGRAWGSLLRPLALAAVLVAPVAAALLEFRWQPAPVVGNLPWALHVMAVAALMTWFALRWAGLEDRRPMAWAVLAALSCVALAMTLLLEAAALTLALGVLVVVAAGLDRRLRLVEMGWFLQLGAVAISYRLLADPGLDWARFAPVEQVLAAFLGAIAAAAAARALLPEERRMERTVAESAAVAWAALLVDVLLLRWFGATDLDRGFQTHWFLSLQALPWLVVAGTQLWRVRGDGLPDKLRRALAAAAGAVAAAFLLMAVVPANPLIAGESGRILGVPLLDSLAVAYALPGALILAAAAVIPGLGLIRRPVQLAGGVLLLLWAVLEIRRLWHGARIDAPLVLQGELYSYTVAMLVCGAALLWQAVQRRSETLRRLAMLVIAVTVAKVFLWDAAGLSGLVRVLSFFCLGLVLAGMAWLNTLVRRAMAGDQGSS
ncbi:DUF2339 domain-containing protein [Cereibacter sphaeroides]|uniref:DUF2339 domain-containing protein n=1 Tax=Cereibacter sphaeroides TaxID=1063 RepID=UPI001F40A818|nr:DUF2339 domain-containing protein [Cereibacter sphaeroides]MCE6950549.1 DUF2339 domain-containing protein [Cereibacter sphaeroides]